MFAFPEVTLYDELSCFVAILTFSAISITGTFICFLLNPIKFTHDHLSGYQGCQNSCHGYHCCQNSCHGWQGCLTWLILTTLINGVFIFELILSLSCSIMWVVKNLMICYYCETEQHVGVEADTMIKQKCVLRIRRRRRNFFSRTPLAVSLAVSLI